MKLFLLLLYILIFTQDSYAVFIGKTNDNTRPFFKQEKKPTMFFFAGASFLAYSRMSSIDKMGGNADNMNLISNTDSLKLMNQNFTGDLSPYSTGFFGGVGYQAVGSNIRQEIAFEFIELISDTIKSSNNILSTGGSDGFNEYGMYQTQHRLLYRIMYVIPSIFKLFSAPTDLFVGGGVGPALMQAGLFKANTITNITTSTPKVEYPNIDNISDARDNQIGKVPYGIGLSFELFIGATFNITQYVALETRVKYAGTTHSIFQFGDGIHSPQSGLFLSWVGIDGAILFKI